MIQHIVLLKLKAGTTDEQKQALLEGLIALQRENKIAGIKSVSGGDNNSDPCNNRCKKNENGNRQAKAALSLPSVGTSSRNCRLTIDSVSLC